MNWPSPVRLRCSRAINNAVTDGIALAIEKSTEENVKAAYRRFLEKSPDVESLAANDPNRAEEKYDRYLSETLLARNYARNRLDLEGALEIVRAL